VRFWHWCNSCLFEVRRYYTCVQGVVEDGQQGGSRAGLKGKGARGNFHCSAPMTCFMTSYFVKIAFSLIRNIFACFFR